MLYPGEKILMPRPAGGSGPAPGVTPVPATPAPGTTPAPGVTPVPATPAPVTGTDPTNPGKMDIPSADKVSYLLIAHTLKEGETVAGVCKKYKIDFDKNAARISQLNGIVNYNYMFPGTVVLLPTTTFPKSGPYYKIMAHTIVAGDTVYDLCARYGLQYDSVADFIRRINQRDNMQSYYVGETIYMPVYVAG